MSTERIREILAQLNTELERVEDVDPDVRETMHKLHQQVVQLEASEHTTAETMVDHVKELESRFAASHPVLEQATRELMDVISKMGI